MHIEILSKSDIKLNYVCKICIILTNDRENLLFFLTYVVCLSNSGIYKRNVKTYELVTK